MAVGVWAVMMLLVWPALPGELGGPHPQVAAAAPGGVAALPHAGLGCNPKLFARLVRSLRVARERPARNGQPQGGKANHERIHTETYGQGSISGRERDWGRLTREEREFAQDLAVRGFHVRLVPAQRDIRTPDFSVNGVRIELKTLQSFGKRTVQSRIEDAVGQNAEIIIINGRNVNANIESVNQQIRNAERRLRRSLEGKIIFWMPDGSIHTH